METTDYKTQRKEYHKSNYNYSYYPKCNIIDISEDFTETISRTPELNPARVQFIKNFIPLDEAAAFYEHLANKLPWETRYGVNSRGEKYPEPRMTCWYGKPYAYSSIKLEPNDVWDEKLQVLMSSIGDKFPQKEERHLNSVMCNFYKDGRDSIGWHADDETSLGRFPFIASLSFGAARDFEVCLRSEYYGRAYYYGEQIEDAPFKGCTKLYRFNLTPGSLLIMEGSMQEYWLHRVPKVEHSSVDGRVNLTYRFIVNPEEEHDEIERKKRRRKSQLSHNTGESSNNSSITDNNAGTGRTSNVSNNSGGNSSTAKSSEVGKREWNNNEEAECRSPEKCQGLGPKRSNQRQSPAQSGVKRINDSQANRCHDDDRHNSNTKVTDGRDFERDSTVLPPREESAFSDAGGGFYTQDKYGKTKQRMHDNESRNYSNNPRYYNSWREEDYNYAPATYYNPRRDNSTRQRPYSRRFDSARGKSKSSGSDADNWRRAKPPSNERQNTSRHDNASGQEKVKNPEVIEHDNWNVQPKEEPSKTMGHDNGTEEHKQPSKVIEHDNGNVQPKEEPSKTMEHDNGTEEHKQPSKAMEHDNGNVQLKEEPSKAKEHDNESEPQTEEHSKAMEHDNGTGPQKEELSKTMELDNDNGKLKEKDLKVIENENIIFEAPNTKDLDNDCSTGPEQKAENSPMEVAPGSSESEPQSTFGNGD